ncbi:Mannosylglycoprotein endo-beta-mannosidase [Capsicum baccatum]|uniref:Mannosylglycoprotein endo-beta-mannosidase n=1 Tax=Capsicum baccatum TaxID=33114 RepID=A0A2G2WFF2_CAPBA|nr:Mannosylglycoprotein endo-beta-mannosidase [Capsicum baccatum]
MYWRRGDPVSNPYGPLDHDLFLLFARDTVKLLRNHPILSLWVGENEQVPPPDVNAALKNDLQLHPYYMNSNNSGTSAITPVIKGPSRYLDSGQFYDHLHDQTAGFYGCPSAAEPIHVQLNLETYSIEVVNTTSEELSNVAIEASVWDLEGECPYNKTSEKLAVPPKKVIPTFEMEVSKVEESKASDDYKLLEPFRERRPPLKITSLTFIKGSSYEMRMHIQNTSKKPDSSTPLYRNNFIRRNGSFGELDSSESFYLLDGKKHEISLYVKNFSREYNKAMVSEVNGTVKGVAFFLHFSVHASKKEHNKVEDTRVLPVHYSDNYFSLVPGEVMTVTISFEVPPGVTPQVLLYNSSSSCHRLVLDVKMFTLLVLRSEVYHYSCKEVGSKAVALMLSKTVQLCSIGVLHSCHFNQ